VAASPTEREQFAIAQDLSARLLYRNISRREFIRRATAAGIAAPTISVILAACGGDDDDDDDGQTTQATATVAVSAASTPTPVPTARPVIASQPTATTATAPDATATPPPDPPTATPTSEPVDQPVEGGDLVIGAGGEPPGLDPGGLCNVNCHTAVMHMFDSLLAMDTEFNVYPWLATSWSLTDDLHGYIFELRDDVMFHDGSMLNAEVVKFSLDRIKLPETASTSATAILGPFYLQTDVVDEYTVQVNFSQPYAPLLGGVTTAFLGIVSMQSAQERGPDFATNPVGSGPYIYQEWVQTSHLQMNVNPDYNWAPEIFSHNGRAYIDSIRYQYVPESATRQALLDTGEAQVIDFVPPQNVADIESNSDYVMYKLPRTGGPKFIDLNTKKPPTDQLEVRQALAYGFNREELIDTIFFGVFTPATVPLATATFGYDASLENQFPYDPEMAAQLLDQAGWVMEGEIRKKDGQEFRLNCIIGTSEEDNAISQVLQAQWLPLGVAVDINVIAGTAITQAKLAGEHHIGYKIAVYQDPDILGIYFHPRSIGGFNYTFYEDPELERLLDAGIAEMDATKRLELYSQVQQFLLDKVLLIPIYNLANLAATTANLKGIVSDTAGYIYYYDAWLAES
jgi:peptide/nickel transport system substrate-binding protein